MTHLDYVDNLAFLANTPKQIESLLQSLEQAVTGIGLYLNANNVLMCLKQNATI